MMVTIPLKIVRLGCAKHKTYKAIRMPKRQCPACWQMYGIRRAAGCISKNLSKKHPDLMSY